MPTTYSFEYNVPIEFSASINEDFFTRDDVAKPVVLSFAGGLVGPGDIEDLFGSGPKKGRLSDIAAVIKSTIQKIRVESTILGIINRDLTQPQRWSNMVVSSLDEPAATTTWNTFFGNAELIDSNAPLLNANDIVQLIFIFRAPTNVTPALSRTDFPVDIKFTMNNNYVTDMNVRLENAIAYLAGKTEIQTTKNNELKTAENTAKPALDALAAAKQINPAATASDLTPEMQSLLTDYGVAQAAASTASSDVTDATAAKDMAAVAAAAAPGKVAMAQEMATPKV